MQIKNDINIQNQGTAEVLIKSRDGNWKKYGALLDGESQSNFITQDNYNALEQAFITTDISVCGINNTSSCLNRKAQLQFNITCLGIPKFTTICQQCRSTRSRNLCYAKVVFLYAFRTPSFEKQL